MSEPTADKTRWSFDKTLNLPTLLLIASMTTGATLFVAKGWNEQDRRIDAAERRAEAAQADVRRIETLQAEQARSMTDTLQTVRGEFRSDLRDINSKLDALLLNSNSTRRNMKEWSK